MTKEELKQEAEEKYHNHKITDFQGFYLHHYYSLGYVESAEPREKRIEELDTTNKKISDECHQLVISLEKKQKEIAELEKEKDTMRRKADEAIADKLLITAKCNEVLNDLNQTNDNLQKENTEAKKLIEDLASSLSVVGECGEEECELINKAQKFINKPIF